MQMSSPDPAPLFWAALWRWRWIRNDSLKDRCITKVIHRVFSGSDVGSKWWLHLLHPTIKHFNRLGDILVYICSGGETMADWWQLTQGGSKVKRYCHSNNRGRSLSVWCHTDRHLRSAWFEKGESIKRDKKNTGWIFIIIGCLCTHCQPTFQFIQLVKVHVTSNDPFNLNNKKPIINQFLFVLTGESEMHKYISQMTTIITIIL